MKNRIELNVFNFGGNLIWVATTIILFGLSLFYSSVAVEITA